MTVKRQKKGGFSGGRTVTVAFSLCLLAVVTMIGMYTVGKSDQQQKQLEQKVAEAEEEAKALEQAQAEADAKQKQEEEAEEQSAQEEKQEAASGSAARDKEGEAKEAEGALDGNGLQDGTAAADGAELESEFALTDPDPDGTGETVILEEAQEAASTDAVSGQTALSFSPENDQLLWPVAGNVIMDYSMDKTVYFATLDQYKYNPAILFQGELDENVMCPAPAVVTKIETLEETGMTVTMDIGDGYEIVCGQLKELPVQEGDYLQAGETVGYISEPTRYYTKEGCNLYFEVRKDGESIDPMALMQ